jgi:proline iminopeptidase
MRDKQSTFVVHHKLQKMKPIKTFAVLALTAFLLFACTKGRMITDAGNLVPRTVDQDQSLPSILINGALLHSEAFGNPDSTMIVAIHGGPGSDYRYMLNCKDLVNYGYRVVFYDQRGSGLSQRFLKSSYTSLGLGALDKIYDELTGVIAHYRTHPGQKVFLLGHSWGAMLATAYVGRHPNAIQGLVLAEPGGLKFEDVKQFINKSQAFSMTGETFNDVVYKDQFITGKEDQHEILDYKMAISASVNNITGDVKAADFWRLGAVINKALLELGDKYQPDFSEGISQFQIPVLFLYSQNDKVYTDEWAQKITGVYNHVELFKVSGVGHSGIISDNKHWTAITLPKIVSYFKTR